MKTLIQSIIIAILSILSITSMYAAKELIRIEAANPGMVQLADNDPPTATAKKDKNTKRFAKYRSPHGSRAMGRTKALAPVRKHRKGPSRVIDPLPHKKIDRSSYNHKLTAHQRRQKAKS